MPSKCRRSLVMLVLLCGLPAASGAEVKVEGVVKAIDANRRMVTVERKTASGVKEVKLEVAEEAGSLDALGAGMAVALSYDSTLELVTKIIEPSSDAHTAEIVHLKELGVANHPWLSRDGLTIYYTVKEAQQEPSVVWMATRKNAESLFTSKKQVTLGLDCTFAEDGLEGIVFLPEEGKGTLQQVKRKAKTEDFGRPILIKELGTKELGDNNKFLVCPGLSSDALTLYCEVIGKGPCSCSRSTRTTPWSRPKKLPIVVSEDGNQRFPYVTDDGLWLFCTNTEIKNVEVANIAFYHRPKVDDPFVFAGYITVGETPLRGEFPRYVAATKELVFVQKKDGRPEIHVVKNFDPLKASKSKK